MPCGCCARDRIVPLSALGSMCWCSTRALCSNRRGPTRAEGPERRRPMPAASEPSLAGVCPVAQGQQGGPKKSGELALLAGRQRGEHLALRCIVGLDNLLDEVAAPFGEPDDHLATIFGSRPFHQPPLR